MSLNMSYHNEQHVVKEWVSEQFLILSGSGVVYTREGPTVRVTECNLS